MGAPQGGQDKNVPPTYIAEVVIVALFITIIALIVVSAFALYLYYQSHMQAQDLEARFYKLEAEYQALLAQYELLESNSTLAVKYHQLQLEYANLIATIANEESQPTSVINIASGGYVMYPIIVPGNCNATVAINAGSVGYYDLNAYIATLSSINEAWSSIGTPAALYSWSGPYINGQATLGPGVYVIVITNPVTNPTVTAAVDMEITSLECHT